jgi:hypothetical protein
MIDIAPSRLQFMLRFGTFGTAKSIAIEGNCQYPAAMIVIFTDYGVAGPYVGQVKARLLEGAPRIDLVDLLADAPSRDPKHAAYLLASYVGAFPRGSVFLCVVDPGVGGPRAPLAVHAQDCWFVGPDNGLFEIVARRSERPAAWWEITWRPENLATTFHGRDLFAPVAARLALGEAPPGQRRVGAGEHGWDWPDDLDEIVYVDPFGNAATGRRAATISEGFVIEASGHHIKRASTFSDVSHGGVFWYENANGLAEIAVNAGNAAEALGLEIGSRIGFLPPKGVA